jgi:predicted permease
MRRPNIFLYSLPFPALWVCCSLLFATLFSGKRLGIVGTALLFLGAASLISWLFVRRQRRDFKTAENRNIILYCIGWAVFLEFCIVLFLYLFPPSEHHSDLSARTLCFIVLFTATLDSLFVWLAFRNFGRRVIKMYLAKHGEEDIKHENSETYDTVKPILFFFLVLVFLAVLALCATQKLRLWMAKGEQQLASMQSAYQPKHENENSIAVVGWKEDELNRILADFRGVYGLPPAALVVTKYNNNLLHISFPDDIEPKYLVPRRL